MLHQDELKDFLELKTNQYNNPNFIDLDPISIPHKFSIKEDIEISAFLVATISWGNRKSILKSANDLMDKLGNSPFDFIINATNDQIDKLSDFYYRTFNGSDLSYFILSLRNIYTNHGGLENLFINKDNDNNLFGSICYFRKIFFELPHENRTRKHVSNPLSGSAAKRLHMMLRWLVRNDHIVDLGIWKQIKPSLLSCPLDVHSGNTARKLGLLKRKQNDAKAVSELNDILRFFDPKDPAKYDFALFGLGVIENF